MWGSGDVLMWGSGEEEKWRRGVCLFVRFVGKLWEFIESRNI